MNFKILINHYRDEDGEYIESKMNGLEGLDKYIANNWPNESNPEDLKSILIETDGLERIILKYCKKEVFEVYFYRINESFHYHKKSRIDLINDCLELFLNSDFQALQRILNKTSKDSDYLRNELLQSHIHRFTPYRNWKQLSWIIYGLPLGIFFTFLPISVWMGDSPNDLIPLLMLFIFIMGIIFWVPGLIIHYQYYYDNKDIEIEITRGNNQFKVKMNGISHEFDKKDIETVIQNETEILNRIPWSEYGFTQLKFKSGAILNLTSLLIDQLFILDKFHYDNIQIYRVKNDFPFLKQKTTLKTMPNIL